MRALVVAQLVEQSLPIPEVCGSNPIIGKNLYWTFYCQLYWKYENKEKEAGKGPIFKKQNQVIAETVPQKVKTKKRS